MKAEKRVSVFRVLGIFAEKRFEERVRVSVPGSFVIDTADAVARYPSPTTNWCCHAHEVAHSSQSEAFVSHGERDWARHNAWVGKRGGVL